MPTTLVEVELSLSCLPTKHVGEFLSTVRCVASRECVVLRITLRLHDEYVPFPM